MPRSEQVGGAGPGDKDSPLGERCQCPGPGPAALTGGPHHPSLGPISLRLRGGPAALGCPRAALRAEPTTLAPLCLKATGTRRSWPWLGLEYLSPSSAKVLGSKDQGLVWRLGRPSRHCPLTFVHWPKPVHVAHGPVPTLPHHSMSPPSWRPGGLSISRAQARASPRPGSLAPWVPHTPPSFTTQRGL